MNEIYPPHLFDHYRHPRNWGILINPDFVSEVKNPSCGDRVQIFGKLHDDCIVEISFQGAGCILSQAAASLLMEECLGKGVAQIIALSDDRMQELVGITLGPVRLKCILLVRDALLEALGKINKK